MHHDFLALVMSIFRQWRSVSCFGNDGVGQLTRQFDRELTAIPVVTDIVNDDRDVGNAARCRSAGKGFVG